MSDPVKKKRTTKRTTAPKKQTATKKEVVTPQVKEIVEAPVVEKVVETVAEEPTMTPTIVEMPPAKCTWRKLFNSTVRLKTGRKVKPNEVFDAFPDEIPEAFKDMFELVSGDPTVVERIQVSPSKFAIGVREDGMYDVCDDEGVAINDEPLDEVDAQRLLIALTT